MMQCPRDGTLLKHVIVLRTELDKCHQCDGIWFDHGELERLRKATVSDLESQIEQDFGNPSTENRPTKGFMRCPKCDEARLQKVAYSFGSSGIVEIDRCEKCLGFWMDQGELDAITKRSDCDTDDDKQRSSRLTVFLRSVAGLFGTSN